VIKDYPWQDLKHAVDFAAACARAALPYSDGDNRAALVAAIEFAERYAAGEAIDQRAAYAAARIANVLARASAAAYAAANAAAYAAYAVAAVDAAYAAADVIRAATYAARAGVDQDEINARWRDAVARDLGATPGSDSYFAACAALSTGDLDLARDLAGTNRSRAGDAL